MVVLIKSNANDKADSKAPVADTSCGDDTQDLIILLRVSMVLASLK